MEQTKKQPLLSGLLILFLAAMIFANIGGNMYGSFLPLYLKDLEASITQIGLFFTLAQIVPLFLQILGGWISDSLGRLRAIAMDVADEHAMSPRPRKSQRAPIFARCSGLRRIVFSVTGNFVSKAMRTCRWSRRFSPTPGSSCTTSIPARVNTAP